MNEIFEPDVAVDGPVVNEGERSSSTVSTGQGPRVGSLERGQRWTVRRKHEAVLRLLGGAPVELLASRYIALRGGVRRRCRGWICP